MFSFINGHQKFIVDEFKKIIFSLKLQNDWIT